MKIKVISIIFLNGILLSLSDIIQLCSNSSICQNGSQCYLSSTTTNSAKCSTLSHYFDQTCLTLIQEVKSFESAKQECQLKDSRLIWLLDAQKLEWIRNTFINDIDGIWIGAVLNQHDNTLRWEPNGSLVDLKHYDVVGRNVDKDNDPKCAVFYSINGQHKITLEPCDQQHAFICESPINQDIQKWYAQCKCLRGFAGRYCEWRKNEDEAFDRIRCANESLKAVCKEDDGTLVVDYAMYGRSSELSQNACQSDASLKSDCVESASLRILMNKCQGRKTCRIERISDLFEGSNCKRAGLGLHHRMRCSNEPEKQCPNGTVFVNERCYEFSDFKTKKSYVNARLYCEQKGGKLAYYNKDIGFSQLLSKLHPLPDSEYWLYNSTIEDLPLIGPRRQECISTSWWSPTFLSQLPCFAKLGWICEHVPSGFRAPRLLDVPR